MAIKHRVHTSDGIRYSVKKNTVWITESEYKSSYRLTLWGPSPTTRDSIRTQVKMKSGDYHEWDKIWG